jgi:hypothetical protein
MPLALLHVMCSKKHQLTQQHPGWLGDRTARIPAAGACSGATHAHKIDAHAENEAGGENCGPFRPVPQLAELCVKSGTQNARGLLRRLAGHSAPDGPVLVIVSHAAKSANHVALRTWPSKLGNRFCQRRAGGGQRQLQTLHLPISGERWRPPSWVRVLAQGWPPRPSLRAPWGSQTSAPGGVMDKVMGSAEMCKLPVPHVHNARVW